MEIELYKSYKCKIREDLDISTIKKDAIKNLGKVGMFEAMWVIESDYANGEYEGQYAMKCENIRYWYPHKDLIFLDKESD